MEIREWQLFLQHSALRGGSQSGLALPLYAVIAGSQEPSPNAIALLYDFASVPQASPHTIASGNTHLRRGDEGIDVIK